MVEFRKHIFLDEDQAASYLTTVYNGQKSRGYTLTHLKFTYDKSSIGFGEDIIAIWEDMDWDELNEQFRSFVEGEGVKQIEIKLEYRDKV